MPFLFWSIIALLFLAFVTGGLYFIRRQKRRSDNLQKTRGYVERQRQTLAAATADYNTSVETLQQQSHTPMVVDLIHDVTSDPDSGGAAQRIEFGEASKVLDQIASANEDQAIDIVIHTLGGGTLASELVAAALKARKGPTRAYVPYMAMSGGTMVALATDEIWMGKYAALGPIDTQYYGYSAHAYRDLIAQKTPINSIDDETLLRYFEMQRREAGAHQKTCQIIDDAHKRMGTPNECQVVDELTSAARGHSTHISFNEADQMKIKVKLMDPKDETVQKVYKLVNARLQMIKKHNE